ncbi:MAG: HypC/HybG/HupF family hydrogenase formation chaperone [Thermodesulfobacteriota bacterium]
MCMAIPCKVLKVLENKQAEIDVDGETRRIGIELTPDVAEGDYVLVYCGSAKVKVSGPEAAEIIALFEEMEDLMDTRPVLADADSGRPDIGSPPPRERPDKAL